MWSCQMHPGLLRDKKTAEEAFASSAVPQPVQPMIGFAPRTTVPVPCWQLLPFQWWGKQPRRI